MRKRVIVSGAVVAVIAAAGFWFSVHRSMVGGPPAHPCIDTSRTGWLTAVSKRALARIEWNGESGQIGAGPPDGPTVWRDASGAQARAMAQQLLEPLRHDAKDTPPDEVAYYVSCDGTGWWWKDVSAELPPGYLDCLDAPDWEEKKACVQEVYELHKHPAAPSSVAGAIGQRIADFAAKQGVEVPPPSTPGSVLPMGPPLRHLKSWHIDD